jgi:hypothetical protein
LEGEITWWGRAEFALEDVLAIAGKAATPGSRIMFEDFDYSFPPYGTSVYEILLDGPGGHLRRSIDAAGRPLARPQSCRRHRLNGCANKRTFGSPAAGRSSRHTLDGER